MHPNYRNIYIKCLKIVYIHVYMDNTNTCCQSDPLTHLVFNQIKTMGQETVEFGRAGTRPYVDHHYSYQVTLY